MIFLDLDKTLIHSKNDLDCVTVAKKYGYVKSYMKQNDYNIFMSLMEKTLVVPITSRVLPSFYDIYFSDKFSYSLVENGAILLKDGCVVKEWVNDSEIFLKKSLDIFQEIRFDMYKAGFIEKWGSSFVLDFVAKSNEDADFLKIQEIVEKYKDIFHMYPSNSGKSLFCTPHGLDKKDAINRFIRFIGAKEPIYIAGDSTPDFNMLALPFETIGPKDSDAKYKYTKDINKNPYDFTNFVLNILNEKIEKGY